MSLRLKVRKNSFAILILASYAALFTIKPVIGVAAVKNSGYYIKEMLMIMPVIFLLTALLDTWVPKRTIMKYLGKESGVRGTIFSYVLGAISAGPIYAAFPLCVMLHKKGASIRNIVVILSSWAVIKVPMLINEAKFLGIRFMIVRWILTVIAIWVFSWIVAKVVGDSDLPLHESTATPRITINQSACMGCSLCAKNYPEMFEIQNKEVIVKDIEMPDRDKLEDAINNCPVQAILFSGQQ